MIESMSHDHHGGRPESKAKLVQLRIRVTPHVLAYLKAEADSGGITVSMVARRILTLGLNHYEADK